MSDILPPRVAVCLAAYNGMRYLAEQLNTILAQIDVVVTVFVSVDVSTDGTETWIDAQAEHDNQIVILPHGKHFGGAAKNFFHLFHDVDFSGYDFVSFADQDDVWFLDKLSHGIKQMNIHDTEAYSANVIAFWPDGREKLIDKSQPQTELDYLFEAAGPGCTYIFTNKAANLIKHTLNQFPELNDFFLHDWLSYAILRHNKYTWFIDPVPKMRYRQHGDNQVGANASLKGKFHRMKYILSGQAFESVKLLVKVLNITSLNLSSRVGVLKSALKASLLRRRPVDRLFVFIALLLYAIKGPNK